MTKNNHLVQESDLDITWQLLGFLGFLINTLNVLENIHSYHLTLATLTKMSGFSPLELYVEQLAYRQCDLHQAKPLLLPLKPNSEHDLRLYNKLRYHHSED